MSVTEDGITWLFYDKFAKVARYDNPLTKNVTIPALFTSDMIQYDGDSAIAQFNKVNPHTQLPTDLNKTLYSVAYFIGQCKEPNENIEARYMVIGINDSNLKNYILSKIPIPNNDFLLILCQYHTLYTRIQMNGTMSTACNVNTIIKEIINYVEKKTGDIVDPIIADPDFLACTLYSYQKRSIYWMLEKEKKKDVIAYSINEEIQLGDVSYDTAKKLFILTNTITKMEFAGGALIDEVGLGKTIQMTTLSLLNPTKSDISNLKSRATLILCPNQLCGQWKREIEKMVNTNSEGEPIKTVLLFTKVHYDKCTIKDLLEADFVIVSYTFLDNKAYLSWLPSVTPNNIKNYHKSSEFDVLAVINKFDAMRTELLKEKDFLKTKNPIINTIHWHRLIIDEFHEVYTVAKYDYMKNIIRTIKATYKWIVTGTPFNKNDKYMIDMLAFATNAVKYEDRILDRNIISDYMKNNFFRRNTKKSVALEYALLPIKETVIWLTFTETERMMYNAYLAGGNIKDTTFLRQLCCHPKLADETKLLLEKCSTLDEMQSIMVVHYQKTMEKAYIKMKYQKHKINVAKYKIQEIQFKRQRRFLRKKKYNAIIKKYNMPQFEYADYVEEDEEKDNIPDVIDDEEDEKIGENDEIFKNTITISLENQNEINNIIAIDLAKNPSKAIGYLEKYIQTVTTTNLAEKKKEYEGKKTSYDFYKNVYDRIKKTVEQKNNNIIPTEEDEETCGICLQNIQDGTDGVGITKCGHIYCYDCLSTMINTRPECPLCRKKVTKGDIYKISYEKHKVITDEMGKSKLDLINKIGTKLANLIFYIKNSNDHIIIFSQWDDMLKKTGDMLSEYGIKNIFCRGNVWQRDKAIRTFSSDQDMRVIMLSSESAASGTNLTKANVVILIDPVSGAYEYRKNTEGQAIGRAHRMGQTQQVNVVRFIVRDTIEEEIYRTNALEDKKHIEQIKIFETTDDTLTISDDKYNEIIESSKQAQEKKSKKKLSCVPVKAPLPDETDSETDSEEDD